MNFFIWERRWIELWVVLILIAATTLIFWQTDLDLQVAAIFYRADPAGLTNWPWQHSWLLDNLFRYATVFTVTMSVGALLIVLLSYMWSPIKTWQRPALYILLVIALGPGLIVNLVFKDHWGRPRPLHITEFGGRYAYVPPLKMGDTPDKSFPCGHCSVGFMFFALYFLSRKRKLFYFMLTIWFALMMAITRMTAGGHFISDILWSGYLVFLVDWLVYYGWYERKVV